MDAAKEKEFRQILDELPVRELKKLAYLVEFLNWRLHGGPKTAEIRRGERVYKQFQHVLEEKTI